MGGDPLSNIASPPRLEERERTDMKKYTKKDFLDYAKAFNYDLDEVTDENENILSDDDIKKSMKSWSLKDFQEFYGFTHLDSHTGDSK